MPLWEDYEVDAEVTVRVKTRSGEILRITVPGNSKGGSNEEIGQEGIANTIFNAIAAAADRMQPLAYSAQAQRRKELGYGD